MGIRTVKPEFNQDPLTPSNFVEMRFQSELEARNRFRPREPRVNEAPAEWKKCIVFDVSFLLLTLMTLFHG